MAVAAGIAMTMMAVAALAHDTLVHAVLGAVVYRTTERATEAGFSATDVCVDTDEGAIGFHYVHHERVMDGLLDATAPEVLVFFATWGR